MTGPVAPPTCSLRSHWGDRSLTRVTEAAYGPVSSRTGCVASRFLVERVVKIGTVDVQPATTLGVVREPSREERAEAGAVPEPAQVTQLVDDDRLEDLRRSEHEAPRQHQSCVARAAAPSRARVADHHRRGCDAEGGSMSPNCVVHGLRRPLAQPRLEGTSDRPPVRRRPFDQKDVDVGPDAEDATASQTRPRDDRDTVRAPEIRHDPTGFEGRPRKPGRASSSIAIEVPSQPRLTRPEEGLDVGVRASPAAAGGRWERDDGPVDRVDGDPEPPGPRRPSYADGERTAAKLDPGGRFLDGRCDDTRAHDGMLPCHERWRGPGRRAS